MTSNSINYNRNLEIARNNRVQEKLGRDTLNENIRNNMYNNLLGQLNYQEGKRHNIRTEKTDRYRARTDRMRHHEGVRHNKATERETHRTNVANENIGWYNARSNRMNAHANRRNAHSNAYNAQSNRANAYSNMSNARSNASNARTNYGKVIIDSTTAKERARLLRAQARGQELQNPFIPANNVVGFFNQATGAVKNMGQAIGGILGPIANVIGAVG
nr:putative ORF1 [Marmot picobirnavirus]